MIVDELEQMTAKSEIEGNGKMPTKSIIGARISDKKVELLKHYCQEKDITMSELINEAISNFVKDKIP